MNSEVSWRKRFDDARWHAVAAVVFGGSVITRCNGRWPERADEGQPADDEADSPPEHDRCAACMRWCLERRFVERGLGELAANTNRAFDVSDTESG